ncbi:MAG: NAD(P)/FAD-dependent oxidoreductase [Candidatus Nanopelagicales bacterium]
MPSQQPALSRRRLLQVVGLGSLAVAAGSGQVMLSPRAATATRATGTAADVIVIGAGAAGLMAARVLHRRGRSVIVLEARDRIGGRLDTSDALGVPVDMGASWLEGTKGNPVTRLADDFAIKRIRVGESLALYSDSHRWSRSQQNRAWRKYRHAFRRALAWGEHIPDADVSLARGFAATGNPIDSLAPGPRWFLRSEIEDEYAADPNRLSLWYFWEDGEFAGRSAMFPGGYVQLAQGLAEGIDVRLSTIVTQVDHGPLGVAVRTAEGVTFSATQAIVTVPIPLLRTMRFDPDLSPRQRTALAALDMGLLNKVALRFHRRAWPHGPDYFGLAGDSFAPVAEWWDLSRVTSKPVLVGLTAGAGADWVETNDDAAVADRVMRDLRHQTNWRLPDPEGVAVKRWRSEPWTRGSYSIRPPGATMADHRRLGESPPGNPVLIAGEATDPVYPSTVHGALRSGRRAAAQILSGLNAQGRP